MKNVLSVLLLCFLLASCDGDKEPEILRRAKAGDVKAQAGVGFLYGDGLGKQFPINHVEAAKWWRKAAEQGHGHSSFMLSMLYENGSGVTEDKEEALKWMRRSASQGWAEAQIEMAWSYMVGKGVPKNPAQAVKWWLKAAEQGNAEAQADLGYRYANGEGVASDAIEAYKWLILSAAQNDKDGVEGKKELKKTLSADEITMGEKRASEWLKWKAKRERK